VTAFFRFPFLKPSIEPNNAERPGVLGGAVWVHSTVKTKLRSFRHSFLQIPGADGGGGGGGGPPDGGGGGAGGFGAAGAAVAGAAVEVAGAVLLIGRAFVVVALFILFFLCGDSDLSGEVALVELPRTCQYV